MAAPPVLGILTAGGFGCRAEGERLIVHPAGDLTDALRVMIRASNCGLMLLQVKASLAHGQWLPWLDAQREKGDLEFTDQTASKYMRIASNRNRGFNLLEAPSIRAALVLPDDDVSPEV